MLLVSELMMEQPKPVMRSRAKLGLKIELPQIRSYPPSARGHVSPGVLTEVFPELFIGDVAVSRNVKLLKDKGITHILNCVAGNLKNKFPNQFTYKSIEMKDCPSEDIFCLFYDAIDFIEDGVTNGKILIHCKCGISRSTAITMAYIMYKSKFDYQQAFSMLHSLRFSCSPNAGFIIALQSWQHHLTNTILEKPRLYITQASPNQTEETFITRQVTSYDEIPEQFYTLHTNTKILYWQGPSCSEQQVEIARHFIRQLQKYENAPALIEEAQNGIPDHFIEEASQLSKRF